MPKYLFKASYSADGIKGVAKDGGTARAKVAAALAKALGGKLDSFNFAFGGTDAYVMADLPDNASAAALAMTVSGSGAVSIETVVLLTPAEMDGAGKKVVASYKPPKA